MRPDVVVADRFVENTASASRQGKERAVEGKSGRKQRQKRKNDRCRPSYPATRPAKVGHYNLQGEYGVLRKARREDGERARELGRTQKEKRERNEERGE